MEAELNNDGQEVSISVQLGAQEDGDQPVTTDAGSAPQEDTTELVVTLTGSGTEGEEQKGDGQAEVKPLDSKNAPEVVVTLQTGSQSEEGKEQPDEGEVESQPIDTEKHEPESTDEVKQPTEPLISKDEGAQEVTVKGIDEGQGVGAKEIDEAQEDTVKEIDEAQEDTVKEIVEAQEDTVREIDEPLKTNEVPPAEENPFATADTDPLVSADVEAQPSAAATEDSLPESKRDSVRENTRPTASSKQTPTDRTPLLASDTKKYSGTATSTDDTMNKPAAADAGPCCLCCSIL